MLAVISYGIMARFGVGSVVRKNNRFLSLKKSQLCNS